MENCLSIGKVAGFLSAIAIAMNATSSAVATSTPLLSDGSVPVTGPFNFGTSSQPLLLSTAPSQEPILVNMVSPGTPGTPGPGTAHHGIDAHCTKQGWWQSAPPVGEMDCINVVARQDGIGIPNGSDAGDLGGVLADVQSTLRAQNFTAYMEEKTSVVDTMNNSVPYAMDLQEGAINTEGHPSDDGTQSGKSLMQAWFAGLIDGHGSGLRLVEQTDNSQTAGKLKHGVIDSVIDVYRYTGLMSYHVDGNGASSATMWQLGTDGPNANLELGEKTNPFGNFLTSTPYIDFNGMGSISNARIISSNVGELTIQTAGTPNFIFNKSFFYSAQPTYFKSSVSAESVIVNGGIVFPQQDGHQTILTTDSSGNLHIGGTGSGASLDVDEPTNFASLASTGNVSGQNVISRGSISYGTGGTSGAHQVTDETLNASNVKGQAVLTPSGGSESSTNNIAVVASGAAKVLGDVLCQNGSDMASWNIKGAYLVANGSLKLMGSTVTKDILPTAAATSWQLLLETDIMNSSPEIMIIIPAGSGSGATCTARAEVITVK